MADELLNEKLEIELISTMLGYIEVLSDGIDCDGAAKIINEVLEISKKYPSKAKIFGGFLRWIGNLNKWFMEQLISKLDEEIGKGGTMKQEDVFREKFYSRIVGKRTFIDIINLHDEMLNERKQLGTVVSTTQNICMDFLSLFINAFDYGKLYIRKEVEDEISKLEDILASYGLEKCDKGLQMVSRTKLGMKHILQFGMRFGSRLIGVLDEKIVNLFMSAIISRVGNLQITGGANAAASESTHVCDQD
jgi:hypothetical protein